MCAGRSRKHSCDESFVAPQVQSSNDMITRLHILILGAAFACAVAPRPASAIELRSKADKDGVAIVTVVNFKAGDELLTNRALPTASIVIPMNARVRVVQTKPELMISYLDAEGRSGAVSMAVSASNLRRLDTNNLSLQMHTPQPRSGATKSTCESRDLRSQFGPPRDQGKRGWCYAYATADYLTWLTGQTVSAADLGLRESLRQTRWENESQVKTVDGGMNTATLRDVLQHGYCTERDFPSDDLGIKYSEILIRMAQSDGLRNTACASPQKLASTMMQSVAVDRDTILAVEERLDRYEPTVLGIFARYLFRDGVPRIDWALAKRDNAEVKDGHAILVVARKEENGKCQYFLRNSWGEKCSVYSKELRKTCESKSGGVWVDRDRLERMTVQTIYLN